MRGDDRIEHAEARSWLAAVEPGCATAVVVDPPYAVGTPVRGREDGAAGSVFAPFGFLFDVMELSARALRPGGIAIMFSDWRRMHDMGQIASMTGLRPATCVAWVRKGPAPEGCCARPGTRCWWPPGACRTRSTGRRSGTSW